VKAARGLLLFPANKNQMTQKNVRSALRALIALAGLVAAPFALALDAPAEPRGKHIDFALEKPGRDARHVADWVFDSRDNKGLPFAIVDKKAARVFVFDKDGALVGAAAALLGIALGDHSVPGVGERELSAIRLQDRTTPAGRFEAALGRNYNGKEILWVDYDAAISMHPVINTKPMERRPHRLATPTPLDNRISFGCINVPIPFFKEVISRSFAATSGIVYVLPEVVPLSDVFAWYDVDQHARMAAHALPAPDDSGWDL
jgi:hypothetical protein